MLWILIFEKNLLLLQNMPKQVKIGDQVSLIDEEIKGNVIAINGNEITIEDTDSFERVYHLNELIVYDKKLADDTSLSWKNIDKKSPEKVTNTKLDVIDLHNNNSYLPKNKILDNQLKVFKTNLNKAIGKRAQEIVFIHGKGEGVLRSSIEKILRKNAIKFSNASYQKYGQGAIAVYLTGVGVVVR